MAASHVSPGGALLRSSRLFSVPKPLRDPSPRSNAVAEFKSPTMTRQSPQYQSITSPLSSREKGDWGFKRPFPLKSTMASSTPLIRVKQVDSIENITDFHSAADHTLSLEKFQELKIAPTIPIFSERGSQNLAANVARKSVFEEDMDFIHSAKGKDNNNRWKFSGPWLAKMTEGEFLEYLKKEVRPRRAEFREVLKEQLVKNKNRSRARLAREKGRAAQAPIDTSALEESELSDYVRSLRSDRATLYRLVSKFLDLAPLGQPVGIINTFLRTESVKESPYGKTGPPPCHPSAGIGYLRTNAYMENHPIYGPQKRHTAIAARVVAPRQGPSPAKLGVGGFIADAPIGDTEFNQRPGARSGAHRRMLAGISHLDTVTWGGAKAYVEPFAASVAPSGKVVLTLRGADAEAQLIAKEAKNEAKVYNSKPSPPREKPQGREATATGKSQRNDSWRLDEVANEVIADPEALERKH